MKELCRHGYRVCSKCARVTPPAQRMAGTVNAMILFRPWDELVRGCMAFRLDDGSTDMTIYPNRGIALSYQLRPACVFYFRNCPGGVNELDMQIWLELQRHAYESDRIAWIDPDSPDLIISDRSSQILRKGAKG